MAKLLAIDLFCGLGGWTDGLLAEGWDVVGFDVERHQYGDHRYPARLVIQDVLTLDGAQFKDAGLIVASPPCQAYSYRAMPWSRARALPPPDNTLFEACFRIQREASAAAGRRVPLIVENVRGAQKWVGRARWNFGSYYLWGDVPALMPVGCRIESPKVGGFTWSDHGKPGYKPQAFNGQADRRLREDIKNNGGSWFAIAHNTTSGHGRNPVSGAVGLDTGPAALPSSSLRRRFASAMIAKIPLPLARHIARVFRNGEAY
jgi:C-5 cytosine-specific DNA methylase